MQLTFEVIFGAVAGLLGSALYAFSVVIYRSQRKEIRPLFISSIKMWVALGFMSLLFLLPVGASPFTVPLEKTVLLAISVLLGAVVGDTLYLAGQERIGVSYAFPISMSFPILTYFLTVWFLNEPLLLSRLLGVILAVIGIVVLALEQQVISDTEDKPNEIDFFGIGLSVLSAILYAVGTTILQVGVENVDPISANFIRVLIGSFAFVPLVLVARLSGMKLPTRKATKRVALAGLFGMAIGSLLYVTAVKYAGATITAVLSSTAPLWAVPVSIIYLQEKLTVKAGLGILATITGVILVILGI